VAANDHSQAAAPTDSTTDPLIGAVTTRRQEARLVRYQRERGFVDR
jgi:hypothetical protein